MQAKSVLVLTMVVLAATSLGGLLHYRVTAAILRQNDRHQADGLASGLALSAGQSLLKPDREALQRLAIALLDHANVHYVALLDQTGGVIAQAERVNPDGVKCRPAPHPPTLSYDAPRDPAFLELGRPVLLPTEDHRHAILAGGVRLIVDTRATAAILTRVRRDVSLIAVLVTLCAVPLGHLLARRVLVVPIGRLVRATRQLAQGDLSARARTLRRDEIGELAAAFDAMAESLQASQSLLRQAKQSLERTVTRRTDQLQRANARLQAMARTDHMTGLANRRAFSEVLERCYQQAVRYQFDLSCAMCDLDHYKSLNDALGHQAGDRILLAAGDAIRANLRAGDAAARYGGDEFVLLLPHTSADRARVVCDRIRRAVLEATRAHTAGQGVTLSAGIASLRSDSPGSGDALVALADRALYVAKDRGKNRIVTSAEIRSLLPGSTSTGSNVILMPGASSAGESPVG